MNKYVYKVDATICFHTKGINDKHYNSILYSSKKKALEKVNSDYSDLKNAEEVTKIEQITKETYKGGFSCYHWDFYCKDGLKRTIFFYICQLEVK